MASNRGTRALPPSRYSEIQLQCELYDPWSNCRFQNLSESCRVLLIIRIVELRGVERVEEFCAKFNIRPVVRPRQRKLLDNREIGISLIRSVYDSRTCIAKAGCQTICSYHGEDRTKNRVDRKTTLVNVLVQPVRH